jgi:hypothetical protein
MHLFALKKGQKPLIEHLCLIEYGNRIILRIHLARRVASIFVLPMLKSPT